MSVGRVTLRVFADELDPVPHAELVEQRLDRRDEPAGDEQARLGLRFEHTRERAQRELEPVRLRLVAGEQQHGTARPARSQRA